MVSSRHSAHRFFSSAKVYFNAFSLLFGVKSCCFVHTDKGSADCIQIDRALEQSSSPFRGPGHFGPRSPRGAPRVGPRERSTDLRVQFSEY
jgi:hypothetical protein